MTNKIGVYWSVMHRRPQDYDYFKRLQPAVFKIMDGGPDDYRWARENLPNSLIIARDWALSEQHDDMLRDPIATGNRHAVEWGNHAYRLGFDRTKTLILGINEPRVWEPGVSAALRLYTIALCDTAHRIGLRVGAMQLSVGWPGNNGEGTPPDWSPWHGVEDAIRRGNHALVLHEYWADQGPSENWGWWGGRALKCPWQVPIVIGECGVDMFVKSAQFEGNRGWFGRMHPNRYAAELAEYTQRMSDDPRFVGDCTFTNDYANREWWSFDVEPAYEAILALPQPKPEPPIATVNIYAPVATNGATGITVQPPVDNFARAIEFVLRWEGGLSVDPHDPGNYRDGVFVGTKYGISASAHPGVDIANLTREQAIEIYRQGYWIPSGAHMLPWPDCLAVFDLAVNGGVGRALQFKNEVGTAFLPYMARRLEWYTKLEQFYRYGAAWIRRCADLLKEVGNSE